MFTDEYGKDIFGRKFFSQYTDGNIMSLCLFVFSNFLVVHNIKVQKTITIYIQN
jgi:hypothetical protein